jgi:hypothetical protein
MKPNEERINFFLDKDIKSLADEFAARLAADRTALAEVVVESMMAAYRKGVDRGFQMAQEVDTLIEGGEEESGDAKRGLVRRVIRLFDSGWNSAPIRHIHALLLGPITDRLDLVGVPCGASAAAATARLARS